MADAGSTLRDVSVSLATLIRERVFVDKLGDIDVEFHSPIDVESARQGRRPLILVYLYLTAENAFLRNEPAVLTSTPKGYVRTPAPVPLDLMYLMVAYAQNSEAELILIGKLKRLFAEVPMLEGARLKGGLIEGGNSRIGIATDPLTLDQVHHVWASFPNQNYRLSLFYSVGPVRLPIGEPEPIDRVLKVDTSVEQLPKGSTPSSSTG